MNTPLEKALVTIRPDLTLQVACGETVLDVELGIPGALGLAGGILAAVNGCAPWAGREDAQLLVEAHDVMFLLLSILEKTLAGPALNPTDRAAAEKLISKVRLAACLMQEALNERTTA